MAYARSTFGKPSNDPQPFSQPPPLRYNEYPRRGVDRQAILGKLAAISEQLYEVIFLKESVNSMVSEQRVKMCDFMRDLKRHLFQLGVKSERDSLSKKGMSESSVMEVQIGGSRTLQEGGELQRTCDQLRKENQILKEKYESMLIHYREEVESLSSALARSLEHAGDHEGKDLKFQLLQAEEKLKQEQGRFAERVKYLESQFMGLEEEYLKERQGYERQLEQYRQRERQLTFQQSQIQRKNILLIEREKIIAQRQIILKQQRGTLDRRQNKISDYEHNQLRRQKQKQQSQKYALKSEYYVSYDRLPDPPAQHHHRLDTRSERERSGGKLGSSRVDINARLREIEQQKRGGQGNFKNSRMSQAGGIRSERSSSKSRAPLTYGLSRPAPPTPNVNMKLQSMLQSLQRDLSDMK